MRAMPATQRFCPRTIPLRSETTVGLARKERETGFFKQIPISFNSLVDLFVKYSIQILLAFLSRGSRAIFRFLFLFFLAVHDV
jgi:hypothetical protein